MTPSNIEILAYEETPLGVLCLRRRQLLQEPGTTVTEITLNHEFLMSSHYTDSERALATLALDMHGGDDLRVLIGGFGLGYTALETLRSHGVKDVRVIEFLPQVISWLEQGWIPVSEEIKSDNRVRVVQGDVYDFLSRPAKRTFDLILIDVDHSPTEQLNHAGSRFYTREGLEKAAEHLAPAGVLAVWSYAEDSPFASALRQVFGDVRVESVSFKNAFLNNEEHTDWLFLARK